MDSLQPTVRGSLSLLLLVVLMGLITSWSFFQATRLGGRGQSYQLQTDEKINGSIGFSSRPGGGFHLAKPFRTVDASTIEHIEANLYTQFWLVYIEQGFSIFDYNRQYFYGEAQRGKFIYANFWCRGFGPGFNPSMYIFDIFDGGNGHFGFRCDEKGNGCGSVTFNQSF